MNSGVIYLQISLYQRENKCIARDIAIFYTISGAKITKNIRSEIYHKIRAKIENVSCMRGSR